ncbi:hypothetical protein G3O08_11450 [Cryomorpha ignava]|uniref:Uncharacterized protein n=1 Tax=Cryomorpha ignava TaxID=101383 RepID=A0A7K3WRG4_9FLAO|nr:hypothetical protein [Cryomorpha ignava]NEN24116.1 hypothetical protein [Cryomorpha ignava]
MERINIHNYEAFFLDFAEGNLTESQLVELNNFLDENPDLKSELESFEIVELPDLHNQTHEWTALKKPNTEDLKKDVKLRDAFFLRAIEKQLTFIEKEMLNALLQNNQLKNEFALWGKVILLSGNEQLNKDALYQFGLDQSISESNFDYFLIALGEGLLNTEQKTALKKFALARPNGVRELEIGNSLKLTAPKGIFYPDKESLFKKEKSAVLIWLYRAAAVAAVLLLGVFIWNQSHTPFADKAPIAQDEKPKTIQIDSVDSINKVESKIPDSLQNTQETEEPPLQEWEVREPDEVNYAETSEPSKKPAVVRKIKLEPEHIEPQETDYLAATIEEPALTKEPIIIEENHIQTSTEQMSKTKTFNSVPKYAEDLMAQKLNIPDSEKDEMAMVLAKRITSKASELLDAEYTTESAGSSGDKSLTYTLRIGNFKVQRTKSK